MVIWRLRSPNSISIPIVGSFIGAMDLKLGVSIISLFALLNKVAGAYGILAILTGAPSTTAQLTLYIYSMATIVIFLWGLKKIGEEDGQSTLVYAHLFAIDHLVTTAYTTLFAIVWYIYVPHDGRRVANSDAQKEMMGLGNDLLSLNGGGSGTSDSIRKAAAEAIWKSERGFAAAVLVGGWLVKVYFILCLYSFALHLRRGSYHSLPLSQPMDHIILRTSPSSLLPSSSLPSYSSHRKGNGNGNSNRYAPLRNGKHKEDSKQILWESNDNNEEEGIVLEEISVGGGGGGKGTASGMLTPGGRSLARSDSGQGNLNGNCERNGSLN